MTLDVTVNKVDAIPSTAAPEIGFQATTTLKRSDFGLGLYGPVIVSDEVQVSITCEAVEAKAYAEELKVEAAHAAASAKSAAAKAAAAANIKVSAGRDPIKL